jgi:formamidopyrimidine-DNA glycosylase
VPELPDVVVYLEALGGRILGRRLEGVRLASPFFLRSVDPPLASAAGRQVAELRRLGKRLVIGLEGELFLVLHLMIAGRLHWRPPTVPIPRGRGLAALDFKTGTLLVTEAGTKKRAALHLVQGQDALRSFEMGGIEPLDADAASFRDAITQEGHTLKRALTDPRIVSGIGNAYSDEILHRARLSPFRNTRSLDGEELGRLLQATRDVLAEWLERLRAEAGQGFPEKVTAFREGMAVHGRFGRPCPVCGTAVQRIRYAENEANYCPRCQTGGRILADRSLSRLLKASWPRTVEELEGRDPGRTRVR